jgi:predicted permease
MSADAPRWRRYLRFTRPNVAADVDDEVEFHLQMRIDRNLALGMSPEDARRDAVSRFGDASRVRHELVDHDQRKQVSTRRAELLADFAQDVKFGWRSLRRAPGFTIAAVLTLALGIGANAAIFSVVDAVVLRPLPFAQPHELMSLGQGTGGELVALRERLKSFTQIGAYVPAVNNLDDGEKAQMVEGAAVTPNLFPLLGARPFMGRHFTEDESILGNNTTIILSHALWQTRFGGDAEVLGKRIIIEGTRVTVVGVMASDFNFPDGDAQYWIPFAFNPRNMGVTWAVGGKSFIARLAPGVTRAQAQTELRTTWPTLRTMNPLWDPGEEYGRNATVTPLQDNFVGSTGKLLWMLFGCVLLVLLIGCVNVANLLLARATARERELAVRAALGGGRWRLIRQLVTESLVLSTLGAALGIGVAYVGVRWLVAVMPAGVPRAHEITLGTSVLVFTTIVAVLTGVLFGIIPALRATRSTRNAEAVIGRRATGGQQHHRLTGTLVAAEVALAVLLAIGSVLLVRSFQALRSTDPGFAPGRVIAARLTPPNAVYIDSTKVEHFYSEVMQRVGALGGVERVAAVNKLPFAQSVWGIAVRVQGQWEDGTKMLPELGHYQEATPAYFTTMGIRLLRGRAFTDADRPGQELVTIVSESVAKKFWPNEDAIGKRIGYAWPSPWLTIVGVVADTKQDSIRDTLSTSMYVPWLQRTRMSGATMWVVARTTGDPTSLAGSIRSIVNEVDRTVAVSEVRSMEDVLAASMQKARFTMQLVAAFALAALLLGAVGIYGVMSYLVGQRAQEMGIRLALGAQPRQVLAIVVGRAALLAVAGTAVGLVAAAFATQSLGSLLYGIRALDPLTFAVVPLLFLLVAVAASYLPARRATRVDPVRALRSD